MPKDKEEKKKLVVVEEVGSEETPSVEEKEVEEVTSFEESQEDDHKDKEHHEETQSEKHHGHEPERQGEKDDDDNEEYQEKSQGLMWIIVLTALLVGALAGGFITYFSGLSRLAAPQTTSTPLASIEPTTPTPTPTSESSLDRADLKVQVLNGSGVSGAAGKAKAALEKLGYKDVVAGNASTSTLAETEISILKSKENYLEMIKTDLGSGYTVSKTVKTLPASSKFDVIITLGK